MVFRNMYRSIELWFVTHPNNVCMNYFEHLQFSGSLASTLLIGSAKALIHAIFPNIYVTSSTELVEEFEKKLANAGCK